MLVSVVGDFADANANAAVAGMATRSSMVVNNTAMERRVKDLCFIIFLFEFGWRKDDPPAGKTGKIWLLMKVSFLS